MSSRKRKNSEDLELEVRGKPEISGNENAPFDDTVLKLSKTLQDEFMMEKQRRELELDHIGERLNESLRILHLLRYAVVSSYYGVRTSQGDWPENLSNMQSVHPAVVGLIRKTRPEKDRAKGGCSEGSAHDSDGHMVEKSKTVEEDTTLPTKVPRYVPPVSKKGTRVSTSPTRGSHTKMKQRIIVGNVSRWIPLECREDGASHKWMVYARGPANSPDLSHIVDKVRFFLHSSYRPFDLVEVKSPPFRISRRGWGEFPIRVQVHFLNPLNKPIDIIHQLTLDHTRSGLQALGSETIVEVWLHADEDQKDEYSLHKGVNEENVMSWDEDPQVPIKEEPIPSCVKTEDDVEGDTFSAEDMCYSSGSNDSDVKWKNSSQMQNAFQEKSLIKQEDVKCQVKEEECEFNSVPGDQVTVSAVEQIKTEELHAIKEEIVIEDGCFHMACEGDTVKDFGTAPETFGVKVESSITSHYPGEEEQKQAVADASAINTSLSGVGKGGPLVLLSLPGVLRTPLSTGHNKAMELNGSSNIRQGLSKGTSLLVRTSNISPGTSLLFRNPTTSNATAVKKAPVDTKAAMFYSIFSNLSKRVHCSQGPATHHLLRSLPLITSKASDPAYRAVHPYSADSAATFFNWPVAKQRASEWMRANIVRNFLSSQGFSDEEVGAWTTKDIMQWARLWGYTPVESKISLNFNYLRQNGEEPSYYISNLASTFSEPKEVYDWLSSLEDEKVVSRDEDDGEEIDVVNSGSAPKRSSMCVPKGLGIGARAAGSRKVVLLGMESSLEQMSRFIDETAREIGVAVSCPEEVIPCVFYSAAQRMLIEAVKYFMRDLIRNSLCFATRRNSMSSGTSLTVKPEDIRLAVLNRPEFDLFTNEGLSAEPDDSLKWESLP